MAKLDDRTGILICGHGSRDTAAADAFVDFAETAAVRLAPCLVHYGCLEFSQPTIREGLDALAAHDLDRIIVAPAMLAGGGHATHDIPALVTTFRADRPDVEVAIAGDLTVDPAQDPRLMDAVVQRIADETLLADTDRAIVGAADTCLLMVGRGAADPAANAEMARLTQLLWQRLDLGWAATAFAGTAHPLVRPALEQLVKLGHARIVVVPYLMFNGALASRIRDAVDKSAAAHPDLQLLFAEPLGDHPSVLEVLASRVDQATEASRAKDRRRPSVEIDLDALPPGWHAANRAAAKEAVAALHAGDPLTLTVEAGDASWLMAGGLTLDAAAPVGIVVSHRAHRLGLDRLVLHPPVLSLGIDCPRKARAEELELLVNETLRAAGLAADAVAIVVGWTDSADAPALHALGRRLGVPVRFFDAGELAKETDRLATPSDELFDRTGCRNIAEAAALRAGGAHAELIVPEAVSGEVSCAIALSAEIDPANVGRPQGRLWILGVGPGAPELRTGQADRALAAATELIGYGAHLDRLGALAGHQTRHEFPLGETVQGVRRALDSASRGRQVALVTDGDPGIFAAGSLVWELMDEAPDKWTRVAIELVPGISAMQAVAAGSGAPLGGDFCAISLTDMLIPWKDVELRLAAAAAGDFAVALYHPISRRRRRALTRAREILLTSRPPETPTVVARRLGRPDQKIELVRLDDLAPGGLDRETLVIVGATGSRALDFAGAPRVYTPRGHAAPPKEAPSETATPEPDEPPLVSEPSAN